MLLDETLKNLKDFGIDEIHKRTHISMHALKAIMEARFDAISPIQFNGFINLIERNFNIKLDALRHAHEEYRKEQGLDVDKRELFVQTPKEPKNYLAIYIAAAVIVIFALIYMISSGSNGEVENFTGDETTNEAVEEVKKHLASSDNNQQAAGLDPMLTVPQFNAAELQNTTPTMQKPSLVLIPKEQLWIGVVNLDNDEMIDTITSEPYPLDPNAHLLISLGHGYLKVEINDAVEDINDRGRVRFHYQDGVLTRISLSKFKELNKGRSW